MSVCGACPRARAASFSTHAPVISLTSVSEPTLFENPPSSPPPSSPPPPPPPSWHPQKNTVCVTHKTTTRKAMAAFGVRACAKTNSTRLPNCSIAVLLDVVARDLSIAPPPLLQAFLDEVLTYHTTPTYAPEGALRVKTKGGKAVALPSYFKPLDPFVPKVAFINVTREPDAYHVAGENDNVVRGGGEERASTARRARRQQWRRRLSCVGAPLSKNQPPLAHTHHHLLLPPPCHQTANRRHHQQTTTRTCVSSSSCRPTRASSSSLASRRRAAARPGRSGTRPASCCFPRKKARAGGPRHRRAKKL